MNLDDLKYEKSIYFLNDGPNGVADVRGLHVINYDSILFMSTQKLTLMNSDAALVRKWGINDKNEFEGFDNSKYVITTEEAFNILYDANKKKL